MTDLTLSDLGWSNFHLSQLDLEELEEFQPARISAVQRAGVTVITPEKTLEVGMPPDLSTGDVAVGDWVLINPDMNRIERVLDRTALLRRGNDHRSSHDQLIAANVDTLFITTSCNADFNVARIERYLALAHDADIQPVVLLTKMDQAEDPQSYVDKAQALGRTLDVLAINAKSKTVSERLAPWIGKGQTVALAGSSGVGKTTVANALTGGTALTQDIREDDARGRHTTTARSLHRITEGGWLIDTPGMRGLGVADVAAGIEATFSEITDLAERCKFRDCEHDSEPGCAVQAAIAEGDIDPDRLYRYKKLKREDAYATETVAQARDRYRKLGKMYRSAQSRKKR